MARVDARELLDHQDITDVVEPESAVLRGHVDAQPAALGQLPHVVPRKATLFVQPRRDRRDLIFRKVTDLLPERFVFFVEVRVHSLISASFNGGEQGRSRAGRRKGGGALPVQQPPQARERAAAAMVVGLLAYTVITRAAVLHGGGIAEIAQHEPTAARARTRVSVHRVEAGQLVAAPGERETPVGRLLQSEARSEERRVGKERRSRRPRYHSKKKN